MGNLFYLGTITDLDVNFMVIIRGNFASQVNFRVEGQSSSMALNRSYDSIVNMDMGYWHLDRYTYEAAIK